jgi:hypothetical protein
MISMLTEYSTLGALHSTAKPPPGRTLLEIAAFPHATAHDLALMPQAFSVANERSGQVLEVRTTDIASFDALEVIPMFQVQALSGPSLEKVLDCLSSMNRRSIPDEQELA